MPFTWAWERNSSEHSKTRCSERTESILFFWGAVDIGNPFLTLTSKLRWGGPLGQHFAHQSYRGQHGRRVKRCLIVMILVEQHSANAGADDAGHTPRGEQHAVVDAGVLSAPEVRCGGTVYRELRAVAPVDHEYREVEHGDVASGGVQGGHGDDTDADHGAQHVDAALFVRHPAREDAARSVAAGPHHQRHGG